MKQHKYLCFRSHPTVCFVTVFVCSEEKFEINMFNLMKHHRKQTITNKTYDESEVRTRKQRVVHLKVHGLSNTTPLEYRGYKKKH